MGERLTRADIAKHFGVSVTRVGQLIGEGRLKEVRATIDLEEAEALWESMDPSYRARAAEAKEAKAKGEKISQNYNQARTQHAQIKAQQAALDLKVSLGRFVDRHLVTQQQYAVVKQFHTRITMLPRQLAPQLALETDPAAIEKMLTAAIDVAIAEIRNGIAELGAPAA